jgi:hypothetical protein
MTEQEAAVLREDIEELQRNCTRYREALQTVTRTMEAAAAQDGQTAFLDLDALRAVLAEDK